MTLIILADDLTGAADCAGRCHQAGIAATIALPGARVHESDGAICCTTDSRHLPAELDLEQLIALAQPPTYRPISRFPAISQDLALIVGLDVATDQVVAAIRKYAGAMLESLALFDVYEGPQVGVGKRSLAYRLTFRAPDRTLSDADVSKVRAKIVRGLEHDIGATLRG